MIGTILIIFNVAIGIADGYQIHLRPEAIKDLLKYVELQKNETNSSVRSIVSEIRANLDGKCHESQVCVGDARINPVPSIEEEEEVTDTSYDDDHHRPTSFLERAFAFLMVVLCVCVASLASGLTVGLIGIDRDDLKIVASNTITVLPDVDFVIEDDPGTTPKRVIRKTIVAPTTNKLRRTTVNSTCRAVMRERERERRRAEDLLEITTDKNVLLVSLILVNAIANEALPIFLDEVLPQWLAIIVSVTLVIFFCELLPITMMTGPKQLYIASLMVPFVKTLLVVTYPFVKPVAILLDRFEEQEQVEDPPPPSESTDSDSETEHENPKGGSTYSEMPVSFGKFRTDMTFLLRKTKNYFQKEGVGLDESPRSIKSRTSYKSNASSVISKKSCKRKYSIEPSNNSLRNTFPQKKSLFSIPLTESRRRSSNLSMESSENIPLSARSENSIRRNIMRRPSKASTHSQVLLKRPGSVVRFPSTESPTGTPESTHEQPIDTPPPMSTQRRRFLLRNMKSARETSETLGAPPEFDDNDRLKKFNPMPGIPSLIKEILSEDESNTSDQKYNNGIPDVLLGNGTFTKEAVPMPTNSEGSIEGRNNDIVRMYSNSWLSSNDDALHNDERNTELNPSAKINNDRENEQNETLNITFANKLRFNDYQKERTHTSETMSELDDGLDNMSPATMMRKRKRSSETMSEIEDGMNSISSPKAKMRARKRSSETMSEIEDGMDNISSPEAKMPARKQSKETVNEIEKKKEDPQRKSNSSSMNGLESTEGTVPKDSLLTPEEMHVFDTDFTEMTPQATQIPFMNRTPANTIQDLDYLEMTPQATQIPFMNRTPANTIQDLDYLEMTPHTLQEDNLNNDPFNIKNDHPMINTKKNDTVNILDNLNNDPFNIKNDHPMINTKKNDTVNTLDNLNNDPFSIKNNDSNNILNKKILPLSKSNSVPLFDILHDHKISPLNRSATAFSTATFHRLGMVASSICSFSSQNDKVFTPTIQTKTKSPIQEEEHSMGSTENFSFMIQMIVQLQKLVKRARIEQKIPLDTKIPRLYVIAPSCRTVQYLELCASHALDLFNVKELIIEQCHLGQCDHNDISDKILNDKLSSISNNKISNGNVIKRKNSKISNGSYSSISVLSSSTPPENFSPRSIIDHFNKPNTTKFFRLGTLPDFSPVEKESPRCNWFPPNRVLYMMEPRIDQIAEMVGEELPYVLKTIRCLSQEQISEFCVTKRIKVLRFQFGPEHVRLRRCIAPSSSSSCNGNESRDMDDIDDDLDPDLKIGIQLDLGRDS